METKRLEFKQAAGCEFRAVIATIGGPPDADGDVILPGAFGSLDGVPVLPAHDATHHPIGKASVREEGQQVIARGQFDTGTPAGRDWCGWLQFDLDPSHGPPSGEWSWGFVPVEWHMGEFDGQQVRFIERVDLLEVSPVLRGASIGTGTTCAGEGCKSACCESCDDGGEYDDGLDPETAAAIAFRVSVARELRDAKENRLARFVFEDPLPWRTWIWEIGEDLAEAAGIRKPTIQLMREAGEDEAADFTYKLDPGGRTLCGVAELPTGTVYLLDGQGVEDTLKTLAHEIAHLALAKNGKRQSEQVCNRIAVKAKDAFLSTATQRETFWIREATLA